jgi:hypothetical protein
MFASFAAEPPPQLSGQTAALSRHTTHILPLRSNFICSPPSPQLSPLSRTQTTNPSLRLRQSFLRREQAAQRLETRADTANTHYGRLYLQVFGVDLGKEGDKDTYLGTCTSTKGRRAMKAAVLMTNAGQRWQNNPVVQAEGM